MKKILLGTSAIIAMAAMGASAHVRDGLVDSSPTRFELTIAGEVSAYQAFTTFSVDDADGNSVDLDEDTFFGQDYSADIDFIAKTHVRDWEIEARVELDYNSGAGDQEGRDAFDVDEVYMDFKHMTYGTFRLGRAPAPSDMISLEAALPGENWDDTGALNDAFSFGFFGLDNSRFADDANQIGYYSPKFGDMFQFGVAYIFETEDNLDNDSLRNSTDDDAVEIAAKFEKEFNGFNFGVSGAYRYYFDQDDVTDLGETSDQWTVGLVLGYMGFNWTTTYGERSYVDSDDYTWGVRTAVTYAWDRWEAGVAYETGAAWQESDETVKSSLVEAGLSFHVFDGMDVHGALAYAWTDIDENSTTGYADWSADAFQVRTGIDLTW